MQNIYMNYPFINKSIYSLMYFSMHCRFWTFGLICEQPVQHSDINYVGVVLAMIRYLMSGQRAGPGLYCQPANRRLFGLGPARRLWRLYCVIFELHNVKRPDLQTRMLFQILVIRMCSHCFFPACRQVGNSLLTTCYN